jgi:arginase family enzyme
LSFWLSVGEVDLMKTIGVPYHQDELIPGFNVGVPIAHEVTVGLPDGDAWQRMGVLYEEVAPVVSEHALPVLVISGACTTSLGILAGLQRAGREPGIVWIDAHGDFNTEATTPSGYLGGMPLALGPSVSAHSPCRARSGCAQFRRPGSSWSVPGTLIPVNGSCWNSQISSSEA